MAAGGPEYEEGQCQQAASLLVGNGSSGSARSPDITPAQLQSDTGEDQFFEGVDDKEEPDADFGFGTDV